jgi:hypothetical protein
MIDPNKLILAIDEQLAQDEIQLRRIVQQDDEVRSAYDELLTRLRREIDATSASIPGACHLRG